MRRCCATCGRPFFGMPLEEVERLDALRLERKHRQIMDVLISCFPHRASVSLLKEEAWEIVGDDDVSDNAVQAQICRLRKALKGTGYDIGAMRHQGYTLTRVAEFGEQKVKAEGIPYHAAPKVAA